MQILTAMLYISKLPLHPIKSLAYPIGRSDGRCVQKAGTHSNNVIDLDLLDIPGLYKKFQCVSPIISHLHDYSTLFELR